MSIESLLSRLENVRRTGEGRWVARCPAHCDRHPSLSVRELADGRLLLHCFGGCSPDAVLNAIGLSFADLFPERIGGPTGLKPERRPFPANDVLNCLAYECLVVWAAGTALLDGRPFRAADRERLTLAMSRILAGLDAAGVNHG